MDKKYIIIIISIFVFLVIAGATTAVIVFKQVSDSSRFFKEVGLAEEYYSNKQTEKQLEAAKKAFTYAKSDNQKAAAHYWQGVAYFNLGKTDMARQHAESALVLSPDYAAAYLSLSFVEGRNENYKKSLDYAIKCHELDSSYAWCFHNAGLAQMYLGEKEKGILNIKKSISLAPNNERFKETLEWAKKF